VTARVHHFDAATLCPLGGGLITGGPLLGPARLVCHCLLVETNRGLVLVDTGLYASCDPRIGLRTRLMLNPERGPDGPSSASRAIEALGLDPRDVRHVVPTHLDVDHAGGLPDFPEAEVHVLASEHDAAMARRSFLSRRRYAPPNWRHGPRWKLHHVGGDAWKGFEAVRPIEGLDADVAIVPLPGHSPGHACVAVKTHDTWHLHAGDAYMHARELEGRGAPPILEAFQRTIATDWSARCRNLARLRELSRADSDVRVFCAHSPEELERRVIP
jgi:glyoxylase-like metal-dependent hydrolase (beta-lactamase superfamily II)